MHPFFRLPTGAFLVLLFLSVAVYVCEAGNKTTDTAILLHFKQTRPDPSSILKSWNLSVNPDICKGWEGIVCVSGRVTNLTLQNTTMGGTIPPELGGLDYLSALRLAGLGLVGGIPPELGNLRNITAGINLGSNALNGSIPKELGKLTKMDSLILSSNQLTGEIPDSLSNCTVLHGLILSANNLSGTFPIWLTNLIELRVLRLSQNNFYGPIPKEIGNLMNLEELNLDSNKFNGTIPEEISQLFLLNTALVLSNNSFTGPLPSSPFFPILQQFDVSRNRLTGSIPEAYTSLSSLTDFSLNDNMFTGELPTSWNMSYLATFSLQRNRLSGAIPSIIAPDLEILALNDNNFTGSIPKSLFNLSSLKELRLQNNALTGGIPSQFSSLKNLSVLFLSQNKLNGSIPASLGKCTSLTQLDLSNNLFDGTIPSALSSLGRLLSLILAGNKLQGSLPSELKDIPYLQVLNVSRNSFSGPIPPSLFNSAAYRDIILNDNEFNGSIPSTLGSLPEVLHIRLDSNELSGAIPTELSNLTKLETLLLQNNHLEGVIPSGFSNLDALTSFNVSNNYLDGAVPGGTLQTFNFSSFANNSGLCGTSFLPLCHSNNGNNLSAGAIAGIVLASVFAAFVLLLLVFFFARSKKSDEVTFAYEDPGDGDFTLFQKIGHPLTYMDILKSTNHFDEQKKLGAGGFGTVYRAVLPDGETTVAIKRLSQSSRQGIKELQAEVNTLGQIHHRNLVTLIGSYMSDKSGEALLIYSFVSGGSLDGLLHKNSPVFKSWSVRLNVLIGSARGLKYLHHDSTPCIIHRDIKPANILLDENMEAHVADFGLAKVIDVSRTHLSTAVSGTVGYMSPEYAQKGKLTTKSDVFSFGVVILQVVTGKRPTDAILANKGLSKWISDHWLRNAAPEVFDPEMEVTEAEEGQVLGALKLGLLCTSKSPSERPSMAEVVNILENLDTYSSGMTNP